MPRLRKDGTPYGARLDWTLILAQAAIIAAQYTTAVTLRQLHYRLVAGAIGGYENTQSRYKALSSRTSEARRNGTFPALSDTTRSVPALAPSTAPSRRHRLGAGRSIAVTARRTRQYQVWVLFEKATLAAQVQAWTWEYGHSHRCAARLLVGVPGAGDLGGNAKTDAPPSCSTWATSTPRARTSSATSRTRPTRLGVIFKHWERLAVTLASPPPQFPEASASSPTSTPARPRRHEQRRSCASTRQAVPDRGRGLDPACWRPWSPTPSPTRRGSTED